MKLIIKPLTPELWTSLEELFGKNGACNGCWCMYWRIGPEYKKRARDENRVDFKTIAETESPGLIAFDDGKAVGWCQVTPKNTLPWLVKDYGFETDNADTWCISCFYTRAGFRGNGIASALIKEAIPFAKQSGAKILEAYARDSKTDSFTGFPSSYLKAGFKAVDEGKYKRTIMRMEL